MKNKSILQLLVNARAKSQDPVKNPKDKTVKTAYENAAVASVGDKTTSREALSRREVLAGLGALGATMLLPRVLFAAPDGKRTFTILHTNDLHSNFIGMGPASDYTPFSTGDDKTLGGYARLAALIRQRKGAPGSRRGADPGRRRLQHGDRIRRGYSRDRRRTATPIPDGLRCHHLRKP